MDLEKLKKNAETVWNAVFGGNAPQYVIKTAVIVAVVLAILFLAAKVMKEIAPLFYNAEKKRRARRRRIFAEHVAADIRQIDLTADWSEERFAELEAEVEAEGARRRGLFRLRPQSSLRREHSLSRALRRSDERLILLEGEPGSGKSVALRHLAHVMATSAAKSRSTRSIVPLYINLKTIERPPGASVDVDVIRAHVLKTLNRANSRDVEEFLDDEFARGVEEGTWLFLFDSFDEIPDVLSATSADTSIREYGDAIAAFLTSMNACRGILASRYFRGPGALGWPRFRILALGDDYRRRLIRRADLPREIERDLIGRLELAGPEFAVTSRNPMFLGLLCQHMKKEKTFPENAHAVFEDYVGRRLRGDEAKLLRRFQAGAVLVREAAEQAAFCMAYNANLGLSPSRAALAVAMAERGYTGDAVKMFEALEFIKLARHEGDAMDPTFTFSHRRFQEYFATSVVLDSPEIVTPETLLTDARWRETAVVLLQTQSGERRERIVTTVCELLEAELATIDAALPAPVSLGDDAALEVRREVIDFPWPPLALHLLSLVQSGYQGRAASAPERLRDVVSRIVNAATAKGSLPDRKWVLEVAGVAREPVLGRAIRDAFAGGSTLLADIAYRQTALLGRVTDDIASAIRGALVSAHFSGRLRREYEATFAHLKRLPRNREFVHTARLLLNVNRIDLVLHALLLMVFIHYAKDSSDVTLAVVTVPLSVLMTRAAAAATARLGDFYAPATFAAMTSRVLPMVVALHRGPVVIACTVLTTAWAPCAVFAALSGRCVSPRLWAFVITTPVWSVIDFVRFLMSTARKDVIEAWPVIAGMLFIVFLMVNPFDWIYPQWLIVTGYVSAVLGGGTIGGAIFYAEAPGFWRDLRLWRKRVSPLAAFQTHDEFIDLFRRFASESMRSRFVQRVRERSMLPVTPATETAVRAFALVLENEYARGDKVGYVRSKMRILDDLNRIVEQMRLRLAG